MGQPYSVHIHFFGEWVEVSRHSTRADAIRVTREFAGLIKDLPSVVRCESTQICVPRR